MVLAHPRRVTVETSTPVKAPVRDAAEPAVAHWLATGAAAAFVAGVSLYRFGAVREARYPGHADPAFYYGVAQNIRAGRGATT